MSQQDIKQKRKHYTIAAISDTNPKVKGIQFVVPIVPCNNFIKLKNKEMITLAANTCQSLTAIKGLEHGDCPNGDYSDELKWALGHLQGENNSNFVKEFLARMNAVASTDIAGNVFDGGNKNVLETLEELYPGRIKGTAFAFSGYSDNDSFGIIFDNKNRNPIAKFYSNSGKLGAQRQNSIGLATLFARNELELFDDRIAEWLANKGKNFLRTEETTKDGEKKLVYPKYSFVYFLQSLIQVILVDYEGRLSKLDEKKIYDNWNSFLNDLSDKGNSENLFCDYPGDSNPGNPVNFTKFCLKKFLDKTDLFKEISEDEDSYNIYTAASVTISNILKSAQHANQVVAITADAEELTYDDYFLGANNYLYVPLRKAYAGMNENLIRTLESLGGQLKYKCAKLNQSDVEKETLTDVKDVNMKDKFGYYLQESREDVKDLNGKVIKQKKVFACSIPKCYNSNISCNNFEELMSEIEKYNDIKDTQFLNLGLSKISEYVSDGFCINPGRAHMLIFNETFMKNLHAELSKNDIDEKYKITYRIIFAKFCELEQSELCNIFLGAAEYLKKYLMVDFLPESIINLMFKLSADLQSEILFGLDTQKIYKNQLIKLVDADVFCGMLKNKSQNKKANEILKLCSRQLEIQVIQGLDFSKKGGLDLLVKNGIIFDRLKDLSEDQVKQIDLGEIDLQCVDLLLSDDCISKLTETQLQQLFDRRKDFFKMLDSQRMLNLISNKSFRSMLSQYEDKQTVLSFVNFEKVISYVTVNGSMEDQGLVTTFVSDYIGDFLVYCNE